MGRKLLDFLVEQTTLDTQSSRRIGLVAARFLQGAFDEVAFAAGDGLVEG